MWFIRPGIAPWSRSDSHMPIVDAFGSRKLVHRLSFFALLFVGTNHCILGKPTKLAVLLWSNYFALVKVTSFKNLLLVLMADQCIRTKDFPFFPLLTLSFVLPKGLTLPLNGFYTWTICDMTSFLETVQRFNWSVIIKSSSKHQKIWDNST